MSREPIRVGILGLERSGWHLHAEGIAARTDFKVVAVADPELARRDEAMSRFDCAAYQTPELLIENSDAELVVVATPSHTHGALATVALQAGRHVLVEKPMASCGRNGRHD